MTRSMMPRLSPHLSKLEEAAVYVGSVLVLTDGRCCYERHDNIDGFA